MTMKQSVRSTQPRYICANERIKLIGTLDGYFPDFGHHLQGEMGGLWLHPIKVLDGFWMYLESNVSNKGCWMLADQFENYPEKNVFHFGREMGATPIHVIRTQIAPMDIAGIVVSYEFYNDGKELCECTTKFLARSNLRPGWLAEEINVFDGEKDIAVFDEEKNCFKIKDCANSWFAAVGSDAKCVNHEQGEIYGPEITRGNGISVCLEHKFSLQPGESKKINFFISASDISEKNLFTEYSKLKERRNFEVEKRIEYEKKYELSDLKVDDKNFEEIYRWIKVNTDWLTLTTSNGNRGIAAGAPEYMWWFGCDSCYAVQGLLAIGEYQLSRDTLYLILEYSKKVNGNGRIVHEILPNGYCPNPGNIQETAQFITVLWKYYEWTGDFSLIEEAYEYIGLGIQWLQEQCENGEGFPKGYGIIEIAGLNMEMIDTIVYTWEAYECYAKMCHLKGVEEEKERFEQLASNIKNAVEAKLWDENKGLYCDGYTSLEFIKERKEMVDQLLAKSKNDSAKEYFLSMCEKRKNDEKQKYGWLINQNWVINTPMETGLAKQEHAEKALKNMHTADFLGRYGVYLCAMKQEAMMTISTGVMAAAQARYGYADRALELIQKTFDTFGISTPGSICEMSPDWGCFVQAWTVYELYTITKYFFGIQPLAEKNRVEVNLCMPSKWKKASLKNVKVLEGKISVYYEEKDDIQMIRIENPFALNVCMNNVDQKVQFLNGIAVNEDMIESREKIIVIEKEKSRKTSLMFT